MTIRKILVSVDGSEASQAALETALVLSHSLAAHVEALHVRIDPRDAIPVLGEGVSGAMIEDLMDITAREAAHRAARAKAMFDNALAASAVPLAGAPSPAGPSAAWVEVVGREDEATVRRGRLADLVVVGRARAETNTMSSLTLSAVLFETGRPVLAAPPQEPAAIGRRIAVSWNGSAEAARAVAAALPFIRRAESVVILTAQTDHTPERAAAELAEYLAWHGVASDHRVLANGRSVGAALLEACADADMLVMGAYTHSRLRQLILGGVTRHMLEHARLPLFMAH